MRRAPAVILSLLTTLWLGTPAAAHHSYSMFDFTKKPLTLEGTVTEFQWGNPHVYIEIDVPEADAAVSHYSVETTSPGSLMRMGWKHNTIRAGDKVRLVMYPLRDGRNGGALYNLTLPDGHTLETGLEFVVSEHHGEKP